MHVSRESAYIALTTLARAHLCSPANDHETSFCTFGRSLHATRETPRDLTFG